MFAETDLKALVIVITTMLLAIMIAATGIAGWAYGLPGLTAH